MTDIDKIRADIEAEALRVNAGRKPKFGDLMRNPWASESNPHRDGYFVRSKRVTGRLNPGLWYEMTNREGAFWEINGKCAMFVEAPAVQAVGEPVAWAVFAENGNPRIWFGDEESAIKWAGNDFTLTPLFATPAIQPPPSAKPAPVDPRQVVGIVDERYLRPTNGGEG